MSTDNMQLFVSVIGVLIAAVGLPLLYMQLRGVQKSILTATHASIYHQAAEFRAHLVEHPHLRKYFFDGWEIDPEDAEYDRVVTLAESFLNYLEHIAVLGDSFGIQNRPTLPAQVRDGWLRSRDSQSQLVSASEPGPRLGHGGAARRACPVGQHPGYADEAR